MDAWASAMPSMCATVSRTSMVRIPSTGTTLWAAAGGAARTHARTPSGPASLPRYARARGVLLRRSSTTSSPIPL
jgi:hypothetical protein